MKIKLQMIFWHQKPSTTWTPPGYHIALQTMDRFEEQLCPGSWDHMT